MTAPWDDELATLRSLYLREAGGRLDDLDRLLDVLDHDGGDAGALADLRHLFHAFAGSGATYGMSAVSTLGLEGERQCGAVGRGPAGAADLQRWRQAAALLRREIASAAAGAGPPIPVEGKEASAPEPLPPSVLVIEEDAAATQALVRALEQEGFAARAEKSLPAARSTLGTGALPDAVIVDSTVDQVGAFALVEAVRARPGGDRTAVLVLGGQGGVLDRIEAIHGGADGHFAKPVDVRALVRRLRFLVEREKADPPRILSVEDDPHQTAFLRTVLSSAGYEFRCVDDPARLESELAAFRPDLILMDVMLPGVSGYDLIRSLRQDERHATLPVVILTTRGELDARIEAARAGGDEHVVKPVSPALLLSTVAARLERSRFMRQLVERDGLTGLLTHTALLDRGREAVAKMRRNPHRHWAWIMIDVDRFKTVNDEHGHVTGDHVLARLAGHLRARLRQPDVAGRYGGDEFALMLEDITGEDAVRLADRLRAGFADIEHRSRDGTSFLVTLSAGVAALEEGEALGSWVNAADRALYAAKVGGRDRVVLAPARHEG